MSKEIAIIEKEEWYIALIEELRAIIIEGESNARWDIIVAWHKVGKELLANNDNFERSAIYGEKIVKRVGESLGRSPAAIWLALQFARKFPVLEDLPAGKHMSWRRICHELLPKPKIKAEAIPLPKGKYEVIVVDPPWNYGTEYDPNVRRVGSPYEEMGMDKIMAIELPAAPNCVLWLWTTHEFIWDAKKIMDQWGFDYKLVFVWDKQRMGMGAWLRCQAEFCLLGIKGKPEWNLKNERDILREARRQHSRKPDGFYKMAERLCPNAKKLDYFSREKRKGWDQYGNEVDKF